jgi:hypothetical protein
MGLQQNVIYYYSFQHIETRPKPLDTEPATFQTCYSHQIVIRTKHINTIAVNQHEPQNTSIQHLQYINTITVNQHEPPNTSMQHLQYLNTITVNQHEAPYTSIQHLGYIYI